METLIHFMGDQAASVTAAPIKRQPGILVWIQPHFLLRLSLQSRPSHYMARMREELQLLCVSPGAYRSCFSSGLMPVAQHLQCWEQHFHFSPGTSGNSVS